MERPSAKILRSSALPLLLLAAAMVQTGCSSTRAVTDIREPLETREATTVRESDALESGLRSEIDGWLGVPHVYGGMSKNGVDCSGFVFRIYSDLLGIALPRTTEGQKDEGRSVMRTALAAGDLVFFKPDPKTRHVGIMLNSREFAHASASRGVMISGIDDPYWRTRYWLARRVLSESAIPAAGIDAPETDRPVRMSW